MKNYDGLYARIGDEWVQVFRPSDIERFIEELENAKAQTSPSEMAIDKVIFSGPATIVFWADGEKTVVKCMDGDFFTYDVGIYVATLKKIFGESFSEYKKDVKRLVEEQVDKEEKKLEVCDLNSCLIYCFGVLMCVIVTKQYEEAH